MLCLIQLGKLDWPDIVKDIKDCIDVGKMTWKEQLIGNTWSLLAVGFDEYSYQQKPILCIAPSVHRNGASDL